MEVLFFEVSHSLMVFLLPLSMNVYVSYSSLHTSDIQSYTVVRQLKQSTTIIKPIIFHLMCSQSLVLVRPYIPNLTGAARSLRVLP